MWQEWKICILSHPQTPVRPLPPNQSQGTYTRFQNHMVRVPKALSDCCCARRSQAKYIQSLKKSPTQSRSKAVVCVSTPRMYLRNPYFLVLSIDIFLFMLGILRLNIITIILCSILFFCHFFTPATVYSVTWKIPSLPVMRFWKCNSHKNLAISQYEMHEMWKTSVYKYSYSG